MGSTEALTFEKVWAMFQETDRRFKETDRKFQEAKEEMKETRERMKETDRQMKETDRKIGLLGNRFGELAEHLVAPNINEKFNALGFTFEQISQDIRISDASKRCIAEIDILLENGDTVIAVEVKAKPQQNDIDDHVI